MAATVKGKNTKQLCEERAKILTEARTLLEANEDAWDDAKQQQYDAMIADSSSLKSAIERRQALVSIQSRTVSVSSGESLAL